MSVRETKNGAEPSRRNGASKQPTDADAFRPGPGLYLVATPIGNLRDITLRALDVFRAAGVIACEDTRVTGRLMARYGIDTRLLSYHEHNAPKVRPEIMKRLESGEIVALCSDAGTPLVSDPGHKLVVEAIKRDIAVHALPGPSSTLTALAVAGVPAERFMFIGFLPPKTKKRRDVLAAEADVAAALVVFESGPRLAASLADMADVWGPRPAAVTRELTKLYEEVRRGTLVELAAHYADAGAPKGEITIVVGPPAKADEMDDDTVDTMLTAAMKSGSLKDAVDAVTAASGIARRRVYARALALRPESA